MYKNKKTLAVITARGGSKGIPGKNIKLLAGKPLIAYTITAAKQSKYLTRCILSSDDAEIIKIAKEYGADAPFTRPVELAQDKSASVDVVRHALNWLKEQESEVYDYLMILQPTSPLRTASDIDESIKKIIDTGADSVMSMKELTDFSAKKLKRLENDLILPWLKDEGSWTSARENLAKVYKRNAAIYLTKTELIMRGDLFGNVSRPYLMPEERSIDINQPIDFALAEFFLERQRKK